RSGIKATERLLRTERKLIVESSFTRLGIGGRSPKVSKRLRLNAWVQPETTGQRYATKSAGSNRNCENPLPPPRPLPALEAPISSPLSSVTIYSDQIEAARRPESSQAS